MRRDEDRREGQRFPIQQGVRYQAAIGRQMVAGCGLTVNISSSGVLFSGDCPLPKGVWVTVEINWPARLDNRKPIKLVTRGKVVRSWDDLIAVHIRDWEFRTVSSHGTPPPGDSEHSAGRGSSAAG
jgi:hypothetical protein